MAVAFLLQHGTKDVTKYQAPSCLIATAQPRKFGFVSQNDESTAALDIAPRRARKMAPCRSITD
jgi:hypothetical protein